MSNLLYRNPLKFAGMDFEYTYTKFYNSDDVDATTAELRQNKMRPISFLNDNLFYGTKVADEDKI